ncbi:hypothetical protein AB1E18_001482 [Capra hircus]
MGLEKGDCACAESRGRVCESRALFFRHPEEAGGQSTRERRRVQHGCGSLAWVFYQMIHGNAEFKKSPFPCSKPEDSFPLHIA